MLILTCYALGICCAMDAPPYEYKTTSPFEYACPRGKGLDATIYEPLDDGSSLRPGVVLIHGGAWIIGTRFQQAWYCRSLAKRGYVVMTIEYRLMPKHPFPSCLYDSKAAVRWLRAHAAEYRVDPNRIGAFGASAGGHLAAFLGVTTPEDGLEGTENPGVSSAVQCVVSLYGAVDLSYYKNTTRNSVFRPLAQGFMDRFTAGAGAKLGVDDFAGASPVTYARASCCPMMFVNGTSDFLVDYRQAQGFHQKLRALGVPTRLILAPQREHGFDYLHTKQRQALFEEMVAFFDTYLRGAPFGARTSTAEAPAPATTSQPASAPRS